jgi:hypothetical protein
MQRENHSTYMGPTVASVALQRFNEHLGNSVADLRVQRENRFDANMRLFVNYNIVPSSFS